MQLKRLVLRHFRNYAGATVEFCPGVNAICGTNAQGKTSLLEAIFLCVSGRSFRSPHLADLQQQGQPFFFVEAHFAKNGIEQRLRYGYDGKERKITFNNTACQSIAQLLGLLPGVVLTPDDIALVKGSPQLRRQYLDLQIAQANPLYLHHLVRYGRAMRQRNHLLRTRTLATIETWEEEMATSASYLAQHREETVADLSTRAGACYDHLTQEHEPLTLKYKCGAPLNKGVDALMGYYRERYAQQRPREMELGWTTTGPHKDDLIINIEGKAGRFFASEGQQRSCVAALRLAEWQRLRDQCGHQPLLIVDDVAVSLDEGRRGRLLDMLGSFGQVFLSSAQKLKSELSSAQFFHVQAGQISPD
ncbi:MAG: DNA replication/repair protein RecF [Chlamydiales bacterium]|nr:DNA replication/repair protein RecF [Chlamydiales bacterium]